MTEEERKKEDEIYGENAAGVVDDYENIESVTPSNKDPLKEMMSNMFPNVDTYPKDRPVNPLGEMIKGLTSMMTATRPMSEKLTLSGMIGESRISIEITDSFTASVAHDAINKAMMMVREKTITGREKSEQDIFEAMMKDSKKSKLLD